MEIKGKILPPDPLPTPDEIKKQQQSEKVMVEARKQKERNERGIFESVSEQFHG